MTIYQKVVSQNIIVFSFKKKVKLIKKLITKKTIIRCARKVNMRVTTLIKVFPKPPLSHFLSN